MNALHNGRGYCAPCAPAPCECGPPCEWDSDERTCDLCGGEADDWTAVECWACNTLHCEDCIDQWGYPCCHFRMEN